MPDHPYFSVCEGCGRRVRATRRYPFAMLELSEKASARTVGVSGSTWQQYMCHGVTRLVADRVAVKLGRHPYELWPDMVDDDIDDLHMACVECGIGFVPVRKSHLYCTQLCQGRANSRESMRRYRATERGREANRRQMAEYRAYLRERNAAAS